MQAYTNQVLSLGPSWGLGCSSTTVNHLHIHPKDRDGEAVATGTVEAGGPGERTESRLEKCFIWCGRRQQSEIQAFGLGIRDVVPWCNRVADLPDHPERQVRLRYLSGCADAARLALPHGPTPLATDAIGS